MSERFHVTPHAARRYCLRVMNVKKPTLDQLRAAVGLIKDLAENATMARRCGGTKRRVMVSGDTHLIVAEGGIVLTVLGPGQVAYGCPCPGCTQRRARQMRGDNDDRRRT